MLQKKKKGFRSHSSQKRKLEIVFANSRVQSCVWGFSKCQSFVFRCRWGSAISLSESSVPEQSFISGPDDLVFLLVRVLFLYGPHWHWREEGKKVTELISNTFILTPTLPSATVYVYYNISYSYIMSAIFHGVSLTILGVVNCHGPPKRLRAPSPCASPAVRETRSHCPVAF